MTELRKTIVNSLPVRIIVPTALIILMTGTALYFSVLRSISDFADRNIKVDLSDTVLEIYDICDKGLNELIQSGLVADERALRVKRALTMGLIEDYLREHNLKGIIIEDGRGVFSYGELPRGLSGTIEENVKERGISTVDYLGKRYYAAHVDFQPWNWHVVIVREAAAYSALMKRVKLAYGATAVILLLSGLLILYCMQRSIKQPIDRIITLLKKGERPRYKGVYEFEYLSENIGQMMESLKKETEMLNNIYRVALSKKGEDFLDEAVLSIKRMFGMNSLIARINPDGKTARVMTMHLDGDLRKGLDIPLEETHWKELLFGGDEICMLEKGAERYLPPIEPFRDVGAEACICSAITDSKGEVIGIINAFGKEREFTDSDLKVFKTIGQMIAAEFERLEEKKEKERLGEQLLQAQKLEAVGRLAGGIAHDFNNILTAILGYSEITLLNMREDDPYRKNIETVFHSANRAVSLVEQLLAFSRKQIIKPEVLNLNTLLDDVTKILRRLIGEDIRIDLYKHEDLWNVNADRGQIEQIIMNLAINARDAMPEGGIITMETANTVLTEEYARTHIDARPGEYVMLAVSDTGCGMPPDVREHIFEPFFTTKEKGKGTGLGLATVYGTVKQNGGHIYVYSEEGKGTTFRIYLPRVREVLKPEASEPSRGLQGGKETVLLVEDEKEVRELAATLLSELGYTVLEAEDGRYALEMCSRYHGKIDLLITDVVMPGISGSDLSKEIKRCNPGVKVLFMSGYTENAIVRRGVLKDGINYIQKPFSSEGLAQAVRRVLDGGKREKR